MDRGTLFRELDRLLECLKANLRAVASEGLKCPCGLCVSGGGGGSQTSALVFHQPLKPFVQLRVRQFVGQKTATFELDKGGV